MAYSVMAKAQDLERRGKKIIHLEIGQPDFETPDNIKIAAVESINMGRTKYSPSLGIPELRRAIADYITKTRRYFVDWKNIAVTPSGKTAIALAMASIIERGDEVIYPDPGFPAYESFITFFGAVPKPLPIIENKNFSFDLEKLKELISSKTKLIIINSPSNPTGGIISQSDLEEVAGLAEKYNCFVLADEIYSRIIYDNEDYPSFYSLPGIKERTFLLDGFSKSFAMTGWRLGYLACPSNLMSILDRLAVNIFGCTATFIQDAGIVALTGDQTTVSKMVKEFEERRDVVVAGLNDIPGITCRKPQGSFYAFPNIKKTGIDAEELADRLLEEAGVAVLPGTAFGKFGDGYLRVSYANSLDNIKDGLNQIKKFLSK